MRLLPALLLVAAFGCGTSTGAAPAAPTSAPATPPAPGTHTTSGVRRAVTFTIPEDARGVWSRYAEATDGFTLYAGDASMRVVAFARGTTGVAALLRAFRTTPGLTKSADEVTKPVDGNDARHLTWRVTRAARVAIGGETFGFAPGERNHAIVIAAPNAPLLVLMSARDIGEYDTVYREGHLVVFSMDVGP